MEPELPVGFIFLPLTDFSKICIFCSDNNFNVLEVYIDGTNDLLFMILQN